MDYILVIYYDVFPLLLFIMIGYLLDKYFSLDIRINVTAISIKIAIDKAVCEQLGILVFIVMYGTCVNTKNINT